MNSTLRIGGITTIVITALLLISFVVGLIDTTELKDAVVKTITVVGVLVLAALGLIGLGLKK